MGFKEVVALQTILGNLEEGGKLSKAGRDLAKTPITSFFFGSSAETSVQNMTDTALDGFYSRVAKIARGTDERVVAAETKQLIQAFNTLVIDPKLSINTNSTIDQLLTTSLTNAQREAFKTAVK